MGSKQIVIKICDACETQLKSSYLHIAVIKAIRVNDIAKYKENELNFSDKDFCDIDCLDAYLEVKLND